MPAGLNPSVPPKDGICISGLHLYNALWDSTRGVLVQSKADTKTNLEIPVVWLKPYDQTMSKPAVKYQLFQCPLYTSLQRKDHSQQNVVYDISLPSMEHPSVWYQKRVFLVSSL